MNGIRNTFIFDLELGSDLTSPPARSLLYHVTFTIIIVGSDFQGSENDKPSTLIFARNGLMEAAADGQYDFKNSEALSPFLYDTGNAEYQGACGAVKIGEHWVLIEDECELMHGHVFITGF